MPTMQVKKSERKGETVKCHACGKELVLGEGGIYIVLSPHGKRRHRWCRSCYEHGAVSCRVCGDRYPNDSPVITYVDGGYVCSKPICREQLVNCDRCGVVTVRATLRRCWTCDESMCPSCFRQDQDMHYDEEEHDCDRDDDDDCTYCPCCDKTTAVSHNWPNTKSVNRFLTMDGVKSAREAGADFYAGIELETEGTEDGGCMYKASHSAKKTLADHPDCPVMYMKTDASLINDGCELVSLPATVPYHLERMPWAPILEAMRKNKCQSHDGNHCGLHIHVNKTYLGTGGALTWNTIKLVALFAKFRDELWKFSRRTDDGFCRRPNTDFCREADKIKDSTPDSFERRRSSSNTAEYRIWNWTVCSGKYSAVNIHNDRTIEIRLWRGTLNIETLLGTIEFTKLLFDIAKQSTMAQILALCWDDVVAKADAETTHAIKYINRRGLNSNVPNHSEAEEG